MAKLSVPLTLLLLGLFMVTINLLLHFYVKEFRNGGFSKWARWGNCSHECGEGTRIRTRLCNNPAPSYFGEDCSRLGPSFKSSDCFLSICPIDGRFGPWGDFGKCDKTCGGGLQVKTRACDDPPAAFGGKACEGISNEPRTCNTQTCPPRIDGGFSAWSPFGPCSVSCGNGTHTKSRTCSNPPPQNGGKPCQGNLQEVGACQMVPCILKPAPSIQTTQPIATLSPNTNTKP